MELSWTINKVIAVVIWRIFASGLPTFSLFLLFFLLLLFNFLIILSFIISWISQLRIDSISDLWWNDFIGLSSSEFLKSFVFLIFGFLFSLLQNMLLKSCKESLDTGIKSLHVQKTNVHTFFGYIECSWTQVNRVRLRIQHSPSIHSFILLHSLKAEMFTGHGVASSLRGGEGGEGELDYTHLWSSQRRTNCSSLRPDNFKIISPHGYISQADAVKLESTTDRHKKFYSIFCPILVK